MSESVAEEFRNRVTAWADAFDTDDENATHTNRLGAELGTWLTNQSDLTDTLSPLLHDDAPAIRCMAASYLLRKGKKEPALTVLRTVANNADYGHIASYADTVLLMQKKQQDNSK